MPKIIVHGQWTVRGAHPAKKKRGGGAETQRCTFQPQFEPILSAATARLYFKKIHEKHNKKIRTLPNLQIESDREIERVRDKPVLNSQEHKVDSSVISWGGDKVLFRWGHSLMDPSKRVPGLGPAFIRSSQYSLLRSAAGIYICSSISRGYFILYNIDQVLHFVCFAISLFAMVY